MKHNHNWLRAEDESPKYKMVWHQKGKDRSLGVYTWEKTKHDTKKR